MQQEENTFADVKKRMEEVEARKERTAQEWQAHEQAKRAKKHPGRSAQCYFLHFASIYSMHCLLVAIFFAILFSCAVGVQYFLSACSLQPMIAA